MSAFDDITIFITDGASIIFTELWDQKNGKALVAFLRHFGCPFCWEFATALRKAKPELDAAGFKLITIGVGPSSKAQVLAEKLPFPAECLYADPNVAPANLHLVYCYILLCPMKGVFGYPESRDVCRRALAVPRKLRQRRTLKRHGKNSGKDDLYVILLLNNSNIGQAFVEQILPIAVPSVTLERAGYAGLRLGFLARVLSR